jgi:hypothetical protein
MVEKFCLKCNKVFKAYRSSLKFCSKDCYILHRLQHDWNKQPEMIANRIGVGNRSKSNRKETWRNVDSM